MVHALDEARRVLVPQGILIDLRPYCVEVSLELIFEAGMESIAMLDSSSSKPDDLAADKAFESAAQAGIFKELKLEYFYHAYYWNSVEDFLVDYEEKWKDDIVLPRKVIRKASSLYGKHPAGARLRARIRSKLVVYEKQ
jgi:hypothetical protein